MSREFWIKKGTEPEKNAFTNSFVCGYEPLCNSLGVPMIHVREVDPSRNALFDEMLGALRAISLNWPEERDGMDNNGPIPFGVKAVRAVIAKAEGKE